MYFDQFFHFWSKRNRESSSSRDTETVQKVRPVLKEGEGEGEGGEEGKGEGERDET